MHERELRESLEALRAEVENLDGVDVESKAKLEALLGRARSSLEVPEDERGGAFQEFPDAVRDAVEHFEVEHPKITQILNRIMVSLSNMGI